MSATWRKVITSNDITSTVIEDASGSVPSNEAVYDAIAAVEAAAGSGDITSVLPGNGITILSNNASLGGVRTDQGGALQYDAEVVVKAGNGITVDSDGVSISDNFDGNGLLISGTGVSTVMSIELADDPGISVGPGGISVKLDPSTLEINETSEGIDIKNGAIQLFHFDQEMLYTAADTDSLTFTDDTKILTAAAIDDNFPNVTTANNSASYIVMGADQILTASEINISDHTDLETAAAISPAVQGDVVLTLANSTLSAEAINLGATDAVTFDGVTSTDGVTVTTGGASIVGDVTVQGDFSVTGTTTTINTETVTVQDHVITLATQSTTPSVTDATESGLEAYTSTTEAHRPRFAWITPQLSNLTGWKVRGHNGSASLTTTGLVDLSVMDFQSDTPLSGAQSTDLSAGVGAFWFATGSKDLYLRVD